MLIASLEQGGYFGLDPHGRLIDDAIDREIGHDATALKAPVFRVDVDFQVHRFGERFDFIIAQSIFSHCGADAVMRSLLSFAENLAPGGLMLATFDGHGLGDWKHGISESGWVYPYNVWYAEAEVFSMARVCGLVARKLPWRHPRQVWFAIAATPQDLPPESFDSHLTGRILNQESYDAPARSL